MEYLLNFREVTYALSEALDLVGMDDTRHGKRVAFLAAECAREMGRDQAYRDEMLFLGMLHDSGVSTNDMHRHLVTELEWKDEQLHCDRGAELLEQVTLFHGFAPVIQYHHTHWEQLRDMEGVDTRVKEQANLIYLVDRVDALRVQIEGHDLDKKEQIEAIISDHSGTFFAPELVTAFLAAARRNSLWLYLEDEALEEYLLEWVAQGEAEMIPFAQVREIAQMFADVVDAKSPFTYEHSFGVAALSGMLARALGLDEAKRQTVEIAALLHDLGKLRVEDDILNKQGLLDRSEQMSMHRHGFDSNMILRRIKGFREIALIASLHHERLDGEGYPYSLSAEEIPMEARIVTVADIFQALVQTRPYREALQAEAALEILSDMADSGSIDGSAVAVIASNLDEAYRLAKSRERQGVKGV